MHSVIDPLLTLQLVGAVLIVLTLPDSSESPPSEQTSIPADREPFLSVTATRTRPIAISKALRSWKVDISETIKGGQTLLPG